MKQLRFSNLDMLRIIAMFFIVIYHFFIHGVMHQHTVAELGFNITIDSSSLEKINFILSQLFIVLVSTGVNLFIMISGYLLICKEEFRLKSLMKLWIKIALYSVLIALTFYGIGEASLRNVLLSFFPLSTSQYWFMLPYFALMFIAPFIAKMAKSLTQKQYFTFLVILFFINFYFPFGKYLSGGSNLLWFIFLYLCAGYMRLYPIRIRNVKVLLVVTILMVGLFYVLVSKTIACNSGVYLIEPRYNGACFFVSLLLFNYFINLKPHKSNTIISVISANTLGVYLLHDNRLVRSLLWENLFDFNLLPSSIFFFPILIMLCSAIFIVATITDYFLDRLLSFVQIDSQIINFLKITNDRYIQ